MLTRLAAELDAWIIARNIEAREDGLLPLRPCRIRVLGQMALLESKAPLTLTLTNDVDVYVDLEQFV